MEQEPKLYTGGGGSNELPDYYLGFLIFYDEMSTDNCKWVVYDGTSRVRCPTRKEALAYINERHQQRTGSTIPANIIDARIALNRAIEMLDAAANKTFGIEKLHLQRMAVKLKPVLVEIDNIVIQ